MTDQQRAHDLALLFVKYRLDIEREGTDAEEDEGVVFQLYKDSYDSFLEFLNDGM